MPGQRQEGLATILFLTSFRKTEFRVYGQLLQKCQVLSKVQINIEGQKITTAVA